MSLYNYNYCFRVRSKSVGRGLQIESRNPNVPPRQWSDHTATALSGQPVCPSSTAATDRSASEPLQPGDNWCQHAAIERARVRIHVATVSKIAHFRSLRDDPGSLSSTHEYLSVDCWGNVSEQSLRVITPWLEYFPKKSSWCRNKQVCQGVKCVAL